MVLGLIPIGFVRFSIGKGYANTTYISEFHPRIPAGRIFKKTGCRPPPPPPPPDSPRLPSRLGPRHENAGQNILADRIFQNKGLCEPTRSGSLLQRAWRGNRSGHGSPSCCSCMLLPNPLPKQRKIRPIYGFWAKTRNSLCHLFGPKMINFIF